jgi:acyl transferase domain-containing protein
MGGEFSAFEEDAPEEIAVIGLAGRFPGAKNIEQYWHNIQNGVESIVRFTDQELKDKGIPDDMLRSKNFVKAGTVLDGIEEFDASFFGCSPREALTIDPQQRIFMETAWQALENAGYAPQSYDEPIGVFAGSSPNKYQRLLPALADDTDLAGGMEVFIGNTIDFLTTRISYKFDLKGPSVTVQTACSTSLVAVQLACQALLNYQCTLALAGGVSVNPLQGRGYFFQEGSIKSPDGHCRAFDADAAGTVFGPGVGVVILKRLSEALKDGDHIYSIIKSCAVNNDGALKIGYTAPSVEGQAEVVAMAHTLSDITADEISYIETHGTGTKLGDPIEIAALTKAFNYTTDRKQFCAIGSVKTNIGHVDAAAGVAGLIKVALMLHHRQIPPSLHFKRPNPDIDFDNSPFFVATKILDWDDNGQKRRAGISSFGIGGTNVHAILEEAPSIEQSENEDISNILPLSAKSETALDDMTQNLAGYLKQNVDSNLSDIAYTLQTGRSAFNYRRLMVCRDAQDAVAVMEAKDTKRIWDAYQDKPGASVVFMFTGQGSQYVNMGYELYQQEKLFRKHIDRCSDILLTHMGLDLRNILYPGDSETDEVAMQLTQTAIAQPALFTIEYALAKLWMSWGVVPEAMIGHSVGEYVAACLAGVFSLEDALSLISTRGRLMQSLSGGSMLAVAIPETDIQPYLGQGISLAAVNTPEMCVLSGEYEAIERLEKTLSKQEILIRRLHTSHAFHSEMMTPIVESFAELTSKVLINPPRIPFISNVSGDWVSGEDITKPSYWSNHLRNPVYFSKGMSRLFQNSTRVAVEVGPGNTLCILARQHTEKPKGFVALQSMRHPKEKKSDVEFIHTSFGRLWLAGVDLNWKSMHSGKRRLRVPLPPYPFQRKRFWPSTEAGLVSHLHRSNAIEGQREFQQLELSIEQSHHPADTHSESLSSKGPVTSQDIVEQKLAAIWQRLLGYEKVSRTDDYFELGGSSMMAARLFADIEKEFQKKLPLATLLNAPTVEQLASVIADENWKPSWSSLVPLQTEGSKPPFYCVHGAGGNVLMYRKLAHCVAPDQPFYGLQSQGLDGQMPLHNRIEDMATHYVDTIQEFQPQGPYLLGGYCMGGTVALEMAQQLIAKGQDVALLAFMETYNWVNIPRSSSLRSAYHFYQKIEFHARNLLIAKDRSAFLMEKLNVANSRKGIWYDNIKSKLFGNKSNGHDEDRSLAELWETNDRAAISYVPKPYPGRITSFIPVKQYAYANNPEVGWNNLAGEGVEEHVFPFYPAGMLVEPFVEQLAAELKDCIEKAI